MAKKIALTPASVDALKEGFLADLLTPGLAIEVLGTGKKRWRYRRVVARSKVTATLFGCQYPAQSIADAREWARGLNEKTEAGIDPRKAFREQTARDTMTVGRAHDLYMEAVRAGRASRSKRINKPRTIREKEEIYDRDIVDQRRSVTPQDLT